jgi:hypothetical protein
MSESALAQQRSFDQRERKARDRSERERRRGHVAQLRWLKSNLTAIEIVDALARLNPPIIVTARTVERDFIAIQNDARRYLSAANFDARFEVSTTLARYEVLARKGTQRALIANGADAAKWARVAVQATEAKMALLQDVGLIDRRLGVLLVTDDHTPTTRIPNGAELAERWANVTVPDLMPKAEHAWKMEDAVEAEAAARAAVVGSTPEGDRG